MSKTIFNSILDNDFYKFTMQNAVVKLFPSQRVKYSFINRGKHFIPDNFGEVLREAVDNMAKLKLTKDEKEYLKNTCPYLALPYLDFLEGYRYDPSEVKIVQNGHDIEVSVEGLWYRTILWEVPLLAMISELYYEMNDMERNSNDFIIENTLGKAQKLQKLGG